MTQEITVLFFIISMFIMAFVGFLCGKSYAEMRQAEKLLQAYKGKEKNEHLDSE